MQDVQPFLIDSVIARSFAILFENFLPFTFLIAIGYAPTMALIAGIPASEDGPWGWVWLLLSALFYMVAAACVIYGALQRLRGQRASMKACVAACLKQLVPVLGSSVSALVCIVLGFMLMTIPGIIVMLMLWLILPVAVIERPGILATLQRSRELTRGHKLRLFGIAFLLWICLVGLAMLVGAVEDALDGPGFFTVLVPVVFTGALGAVFTAVIYHDLRALKDGPSVEDFAHIFE